MLTNQQAMDFVTKIEEPFKSLPHLPKNITEIFVKIAPFFALLGAVLGLLSGPIVGLLGSLASLFTLSPMFLIWTVLTVILTLLSSILLFMAYNPLKLRQMRGWMLLFWCNIISIVEGVLGLVWGSHGSFIGTILGIVIGLYILFEMKPFYDGAVVGEVIHKAKKIS